MFYKIEQTKFEYNIPATFLFDSIHQLILLDSIVIETENLFPEKIFVIISN
jgi:hypothetical protein